MTGRRASSYWALVCNSPALSTTGKGPHLVRIRSSEPICFSVTSTSSTPPIHQLCRPWRLRRRRSSFQRARRSSASGATTSPTPRNSATQFPRSARPLPSDPETLPCFQLRSRRLPRTPSDLISRRCPCAEYVAGARSVPEADLVVPPRRRGQRRHRDPRAARVAAPRGRARRRHLPARARCPRGVSYGLRGR